MAAVEFVKGEGRRYRSLLHRDDGVTVEFDGGAWNRVGGPARELPHDLAHLIVEDELGLRRGVWGVLAAGGMFRHARVVAGRRRPHATATGRTVIRESDDEITRAEMLVRAVCDVGAGADARGLRAAVGERWWSDALTPEAADRAVARLRAAAEDWRDLAPGESLRAEWRLR
ncbi:MAG: hypothetical protein AB7V62_16605 [Thermoleophilia bacterium]